MEEKALTTIDRARQKFELACKDAEALQIVNNFGGAFQAVSIVALLRDALSDEVMNKVFVPLMNTKIGFLTDRNGRPNGKGQSLPPYGNDVVRDAIIDAVCIGLLPTGNQFNIIAGRMYPTKEGYTALLRRMGVKYYINVSCDGGQNQNYAEIPCKISYEYKGEKNSFGIIATVKKDSYSSADQLRGKAERRAKKALYEYLTGCDFGDADEQSSAPIETTAERVETEVREQANKGGKLDFDPETGEVADAGPAPAKQPARKPAPAPAYDDTPVMPGF